MATTKITSPDLFNLESLSSALKLPSGTTAQRPTSPSTGEWRYNTTTNLIEFWDGGAWTDLQSENIPPVNSENFNVVLYTGNGSTQSITGVGFKPDYLVIKDRSATNSWRAFDSSRGLTSPQTLFWNLDFPEDSESNTVSSFDADGFTMGSQGGVNTNGDNYVAYCWKADGGTTSSNTDGSTTSTVQANTKAGFSIVTYTGTGANATVGHGLGAQPYLVITKGLDTVVGNTNWKVYTNALGGTKNLSLNSNGAAATGNSTWNDTDPTSSVFSLGTSGDPNGNGATYVAYCFAPVAGYSSFGSYTGNGADKVVSTGFEPAFLIVKKTDSSGNPWAIWDNKRNTLNPRNSILQANTNDGDLTSSSLGVNFLSNGFELIGNNGDFNDNGGAYIYIAFGSDASAAPTLADSFANKLYTGNGGTQAITGLGFSPSFVWLKCRSVAHSHFVADSIRGVTKYVMPNETSAELTRSDQIQSFDSDGFTLGGNGDVNGSSKTYVAWNWKANTNPSINTDGTIQSIVSANQAAGFSIVKWTTNGSASQYVGHGLSVAPSIIIYKRLDGSQDWFFETDIIGGSYNYLNLNTSGAVQAGGAAWSTRSTSTTISAFTSSNNFDYIAYCFTSISGFSKFGTYDGSASAVSVDTGFQASFVLIKRTDTGTTFWNIFDSARGGDKRLYPNSSNVETDETSDYVTFDSDGFNVDVTSNSDLNQSGGTFLYMAFKENPTIYPVAGTMSFLTIAGGGGGGNRHAGGGGGGGMRTSYGPTSGGGSSAESDITLAAGTYTITVGGGGAGVAYNTTAGVNGTNSVLSGTGMTTITSDGGGGGGIYHQPTGSNIVGSAGGSGGGGGSVTNGGSATANQGKDGGQGTGQTAPDYGGGGGGGATLIGNNGSGSGGGNGGNGLAVSITGASVAYAGGGGGSSFTNQSARGLGGNGGGGDGAANATTPQSGTANLGGGGGGTTYDGGFSGAGGAGVVILRLLTSEYSSSTTGSPTVTTDGDYTILTYTGSGTYVHS